MWSGCSQLVKYKSSQLRLERQDFAIKCHHRNTYKKNLKLLKFLLVGNCQITNVVKRIISHDIVPVKAARANNILQIVLQSLCTRSKTINCVETVWLYSLSKGCFSSIKSQSTILHSFSKTVEKGLGLFLVNSADSVDFHWVCSGSVSVSLSKILMSKFTFLIEKADKSLSINVFKMCSIFCNTFLSECLKFGIDRTLLTWLS